MWKKCSEGQSGSDCRSGSATGYTWQQALQQAQTVNQSGFAGYKDWRVPNVNELNSIVEEQCYEPAVNLSIFPNTPSSWYWSSSSLASYSSSAWSVHFGYGNTGSDLKYYGLYVRLVR
jgi:hypothetical protein